jgi:hypothetical protein
MNWGKIAVPALLLAALAWIAPGSSEGAAQENLKPFRGVIHVHSNFSTGELSPAEIVPTPNRPESKLLCSPITNSSAGAGASLPFAT